MVVSVFFFFLFLLTGFFKLQSKDVVPVVVVSLVPLLLVAALVVTFFYFYRNNCDHKPRQTSRSDWTAKGAPELYQTLDLLSDGGRGGADTHTLPEQSVDTDNISDVNNWQGNLAEPLHIKLEVLIGKGRFAEVWRACLLQGERDGVSSYETVAVKVFPALEYTSWRNEFLIFTDPKLKHENVVQFLAAEERGLPGHPHRKYWLVLEYCSFGNLQDFLTANTLSWEELVALAGSVAKGLAHLHSDMTPSGVPKVRTE